MCRLKRFPILYTWLCRQQKPSDRCGAAIRGLWFACERLISSYKRPAQGFLPFSSTLDICTHAFDKSKKAASAKLQKGFLCLPDIHLKMPNHDLLNRDLAFSRFRNRRDKLLSVFEWYSISVQILLSYDFLIAFSASSSESLPARYHQAGAF